MTNALLIYMAYLMTVEHFNFRRLPKWWEDVTSAVGGYRRYRKAKARYLAGLTPGFSCSHDFEGLLKAIWR